MGIKVEEDCYYLTHGGAVVYVEELGGGEFTSYQCFGIGFYAGTDINGAAYEFIDRMTWTRDGYYYTKSDLVQAGYRATDSHGNDLVEKLDANDPRVLVFKAEAIMDGILEWD